MAVRLQPSLQCGRLPLHSHLGGGSKIVNTNLTWIIVYFIRSLPYLPQPAVHQSDVQAKKNFEKENLFWRWVHLRHTDPAERLICMSENPKKVVFCILLHKSTLAKVDQSTSAWPLSQTCVTASRRGKGNPCPAQCLARCPSLGWQPACRIEDRGGCACQDSATTSIRRRSWERLLKKRHQTFEQW